MQNGGQKHDQVCDSGRFSVVSARLGMHRRASNRGGIPTGFRTKAQVGAPRLPWGRRPHTWPNPNDVASERHSTASTPLGLKPLSPFFLHPGNICRVTLPLNRNPRIRYFGKPDQEARARIPPRTFSSKKMKYPIDILRQIPKVHSIRLR